MEIKYNSLEELAIAYGFIDEDFPDEWKIVAITERWIHEAPLFDDYGNILDYAIMIDSVEISKSIGCKCDVITSSDIIVYPYEK